MINKRISTGQITMTRAERQRREALQHRRIRKAGAPVFGNIVLIVLLLCAAAMVYVLIKSKATGEALELAGRQLYIVLGSSMEPTVGPGSLLVVKAVDPADLEREDVITFIDPADPERVISSRIVEIDGLSFITRGDANKMNDPGTVPAENILGKGECFVPYAGYILNFAQTATGLITMVLIPSLVIVLYEFINLLRYAAAMEKKRGAGAGMH